MMHLIDFLYIYFLKSVYFKVLFQIISYYEDDEIVEDEKIWKMFNQILKVFGVKKHVKVYKKFH